MAQQEMVFSDYLRVIVKHKTTVVVVTALVTIFTFVWSSSKEPIFSSKATVKLLRLETLADLFGELLVTSGDPIDNYVYEITSDRILEPAAQALVASGDLITAEELRPSVKAARVERTDLIDINSQGASAVNARERCAAVVKAFVDVHGQMISVNAREQARDIQKSLDGVTNNLAGLEAEYKGKLEGMLLLESEEAEINALRVKLIDSQVRLQTLTEDGNYTAEYPEIVAMKKTVAALESRINELTRKQIETRAVAQEYEQRKKVLEDMLTFLTRRLEESKIAETRKSERIEVIEKPSPGARVTTAGAYLTAIGLMLGLMLGVILAFVSETLDTSLRSLLDIEKTFGLPILGVIPDFALIDSNAPIRPEGIVERVKYSEFVHTLSLFWRALASFAARRGKSSRSSGGLKPSPLIVPSSPRSPATEGYRAIRTSLQLAVGEKKLGAILVTSASPAEGKSTTLANLGYVFAQGGKKTLLVNANMRRPTMCDTFGLTKDRGLSDILSGEVTWRETVKDHRDLSIGARVAENLGSVPGAENLFIITEGGRTIHPAEWLSLPIFESLVREWEAEFDVVLIDGPPLLPVPDSMIMSSAIGEVVLVFQIGVTQRDSLLRAISMIRKGGAEIRGLVLNRLHASWSASPDYLHYRGYYGRPDK